MRRPQIGCTGRGRNVAISNVSVANTPTLIAAGDGMRISLTVQHVDTVDSTTPIWVSNSATIAIGEGFYLSGLGAVLSILREGGAGNPWYGISTGNTVTVAVATGER